MKKKPKIGDKAVLEFDANREDDYVLDQIRDYPNTKLTVAETDGTLVWFEEVDGAVSVNEIIVTES